MDRGEVLVDQPERRELLERKIGKPRPVHQGDLQRDEAERVTVRRCSRDRLVADHARSAGAVHDVHRLLEIALHDVGDLARDRVGAAAGGPRHDQRDGSLRESRLRVAGAEQAYGCKRSKGNISGQTFGIADYLAKHSQTLPILFLMRRALHRGARFLRYPPFGRRSAGMSRGSAGTGRGERHDEG